MEHISTKQIQPVYLKPEDSLMITYTDINGAEHILDSVQYESQTKIDQIAFFKLKNEHGFMSGVAAMVGERE